MQKNNKLNEKSHEKIASKNPKEAWWQPAMILFFRLSVWITLPIVIGAFIGKWLEKKFESGFWLFLVCIGAAFIVSIIGLVRNTLQEYRKIDKKFDQKNKI
ncbi:MAG: AtpZ/AtpI family protein [Patescibacteria group bacterium]|nr:AtpZ/AtpI family protein [Patescibacteria group bacterium]